MNDNISEFQVATRKDFVAFLSALHQDFLTNSEEWENVTLPAFLEALGAYAEDIQSYYDNFNLQVDADKPSWQTFADIFKGAMIYE